MDTSYLENQSFIIQSFQIKQEPCSPKNDDDMINNNNYPIHNMNDGSIYIKTEYNDDQIEFGMYHSVKQELNFTHDNDLTDGFLFNNNFEDENNFGFINEHAIDEESLQNSSIGSGSNLANYQDFTSSEIKNISHDDTLNKIKNVKVVLERLSVLKILNYTKKSTSQSSSKTNNVEIFKSICAYYCSKCDKKTKIITTPIWKNKKCSECQSLICLQCQRCHREYSTTNGFINHYNSSQCCSEFHKPDLSLQCSKCGLAFRHCRTSYTRHIKHCGNQPNFFCQMCSYKTKWSKSFKHHMKIHANASMRSNNISINGDVSVQSDCDNVVNDQAATPTQINSHISEMYIRYCPKCQTHTKNSTFKNSKRCRECSSDLQFECQKCDKRFKTYSGVVSHIRSFENHMRICKIGDKLDTIICYCSKCDKLDLHHTLQNVMNCNACQTKYIYQCIKCGKELLHYDSVIRHLEKICKISKDFCCFVCNVEFLSLDALNTHLSQCNRKELDLSCDNCSFTTRFKLLLEDHLKIHRNENLKTARYNRICTQCNNIMKDFANLRVFRNCHICKAKNSVVYQCKQCKTKDIKSYPDMRRHIKVLCTVINNRVKKRRLKYPAINNRVKEKRLECPKCQQVYQNRDSLKKHITYCNPGNQTLSCEHCLYTTTSKMNLTKHMLVHIFGYQGNNDYENFQDAYCPKCDTKRRGINLRRFCFKCKTCLLWPCNMCDKKSISRKALCLHINRKHVLETNCNKCLQCDKVFANIYNLRMHEKICKSEINVNPIDGA